MQNPVQQFVQCQRAREQTRAQVKPVIAQEGLARDKILENMVEEKRPFLDLGNGEYIVLKPKNNRPKLTPDLIGYILELFMAKRGVAWVEQDTQEFLNFLNVNIVHMTTPTKPTIELTDKRPMRSFCQKI